MRIRDFELKKNNLFDEEVLSNKKNNWPVVYILNNSKDVYIGETNNLQRRVKQHLDSPDKQGLVYGHSIEDDEFNKSATLDIESKLISYFDADKKFNVLNANAGSASEYYNRTHYLNKVPVIWERLRKKKLADKTVFEIENSDLFKFSPYKSLSQEQFYISELIFDRIENEESTLSFIEGNPGTGKTVMAMYFLKHYAEKYGNKEVALVVAMDSLYKTLRNVAKSINGLKAYNVIKPGEVKKKEYKVLIVDEAHRLKRRKNLSSPGEFSNFDKTNEYFGFEKFDGTQLDWILTQSHHQILFYDDNQSVKPSDIPKYRFDELKTEDYGIRDISLYTLESQHRVKGGNEFIQFVTELLNVKITKDYNFKNYDVKLHPSFKTFNDTLYIKQKEYGLCRMISGYSFKWESKKDDTMFDIVIEGIQKKWNTVAIDWPNSPFALDEVGCIHTIQGYDLNYAFLIFGKEIDYNPELNEISIDKEQYYDINGKAGLKNYFELKEYVLNIYKTMMTRGIQGLHIYACNKNLQEYLSKYIKQVN